MDIDLSPGIVVQQNIADDDGPVGMKEIKLEVPV